MVAVGIFVVWAGYAAGLWGYCLIRGYNITPGEIMSGTWPPLVLANQKTDTTTTAPGHDPASGTPT